MAVEVITSFGRQVDSNGTPLSGAKVYVYDVGTTTSKSVYSDKDLAVAADNPIVCDAYGLHDMRYIATGSYKIVVKTSADVTVYTRDNIDGRVPVGSGALAIANGGTGATTAEAALAALGAATAAELAEVTEEVSSLSGSLASTEKTHIATGTTAQREADPVEGDIRRNTTTSKYEGHDGSSWINFITDDSDPVDFKSGFARFCTQYSKTTLTSAQTITSTIALDNTAPQISEGTQVTGFSVSFTPKTATSVVRIRVVLDATPDSNSRGVAALFRAGTVDALAAVPFGTVTNTGSITHSYQPAIIEYEYSPGATTALTFSVRVGENTGGNVYINSNSGGATLGGKRISFMEITEWETPT